MTETSTQIKPQDEQTTPDLYDDRSIRKTFTYDDRLDFLRAVASFGVVLLHTVGPIVSEYSGVATPNWWFANVINSMVRWSVPVFFMISGYLYLKNTECWLNFFTKRLIRVGVPLLFWSIFFVCFSVYYEGEHISILYFLRLFLLGNCYFHLWFLYALIGLIASVPIFYALWNKFGNRGFTFYLIVWFFVSSIAPFISQILSLMNVTKLDSSFDFHIFSGYSGFLLLGAMLGRHKFTTLQTSLAVFVFAATVILTCGGSYWVSSIVKVFRPTFYSYTSPTVVTMACSIYIVLLAMAQNIASIEKLKWLVQVYRFLGKTSFGVYLIHPVYLRLFRDIGLAPTTAMDEVWIFYFGLKICISAICTYLFSLAIVALFLRIPLLNKVV